MVLAFRKQLQTRHKVATYVVVMALDQIKPENAKCWMKNSGYLYGVELHVIPGEGCTSVVSLCICEWASTCYVSVSIQACVLVSKCVHPSIHVAIDVMRYQVLLSFIVILSWLYCIPDIPDHGTHQVPALFSYIV